MRGNFLEISLHLTYIYIYNLEIELCTSSLLNHGSASFLLVARRIFCGPTWISQVVLLEFLHSSIFSCVLSSFYLVEGVEEPPNLLVLSFNSL